MRVFIFLGIGTRQKKMLHDIAVPLIRALLSLTGQYNMQHKTQKLYTKVNKSLLIQNL